MTAGGVPADHAPGEVLRLHASVVAVGAGGVWRGILITGASGAGKSALALQLMAVGARLVSDDQTLVHRRGAVLRARAPDILRGLIEARGVGLLTADALVETDLMVAIDLDRQETERLPQPRSVCHLGVTIPMLGAVPGPSFPAAVTQYIIGAAPRPPAAKVNFAQETAPPDGPLRSAPHAAGREDD